MKTLTTPRKLSRAKSVGFRPGARLRTELEQFGRELAAINPTLSISDILRDGVSFYWPHIRAYLIARTRFPDIPPSDVQQIVFSALRAHRRGLSPREIGAALHRASAAKGLHSAQDDR